MPFQRYQVGIKEGNVIRKLRELDFVFKDFDAFYVGVLTGLVGSRSPLPCVGRYFGRENEQVRREREALSYTFRWLKTVCNKTLLDLRTLYVSVKYVEPAFDVAFKVKMV